MQTIFRAIGLSALILSILTGCGESPPKPPPAAPGGADQVETKPPVAAAAREPAAAAAAADHEPLVDESKRREASMSLLRGALYLLAEQRDDGSWAGHPGITAVCLAALAETGVAQTEEGRAAFDTALAYLRQRITADGKVKLATAEEDIYSASVCLLALRALNRDEDKTRIEKIRQYLIAAQIKGSSDFNYGGGLGYKSYPDLSNTHWALEAIWATRQKEPPARVKKLWQRSTAFIAICQITDSEDPKRQGGFLYYPVGREPEKPAHEKTEVVWGSLSLGAMKSLYYAGVKTDDKRIARGLTWFANNYSLTRNPGLESGGLYYYYYMLSSALFFMQQDYVVTPAGKKYNWRQDLVAELLTKQGGDGQWVNQNRLWLESNAPLCTAYAMKAMQFALRE